jgi:hypothetical protein
MLPRLCTTGTVVCIASGPSLTTEDCEYVRGKATVIAVNDAVRLAPWADVLYSSDRVWWTKNKKRVKDFAGLRVKVATKPWVKTDVRKYPFNDGGILILKNYGDHGLELQSDGIRNIQNSGSAAINVAVHLGAKRILLLGYDMGVSKGRAHFYDTKPVAIRSPYIWFRQLTKTMVKPLKAAGIDVINCSRETALEHFPRQPLREALC